MTPPYVPLETIQLLSETSFSKIKNKKVIRGGTLKWDTLYIAKRNGHLVRRFDEIIFYIRISLKCV